MCDQEHHRTAVKKKKREREKKLFSYSKGTRYALHKYQQSFQIWGPSHLFNFSRVSKITSIKQNTRLNWSYSSTKKAPQGIALLHLVNIPYTYSSIIPFNSFFLTDKIFLHTSWKQAISPCRIYFLFQRFNQYILKRKKSGFQNAAIETVPHLILNLLIYHSLLTDFPHLNLNLLCEVLYRCHVYKFKKFPFVSIRYS